MKLFGFEITRTKAILPTVPVHDGAGWFPVIREPFPGAWQRNMELRRESILSFHAVAACVSRIAHDISKLRMMLLALEGDVWVETSNPAYSPVLRDPNGMQNDKQFWEFWLNSKLLRGNAYVLKGRDERGVVNRLWVLHPDRCKPLIADDGSVFYQINADNVAGVGEITVPAREIIHDRWNCFFHPLVGTSPIFACGMTAAHGLHIQQHSSTFFANRGMPGGMLTAPGKISQPTADELRDKFQSFFSGTGAGRLAVVGDGMKFEPIAMTADDAQLIEQLKWTAEVVCGCFGVPPYKVGVGAPPPHNNIQALNIEYYQNALQKLMEDAETCLDRGLNLPSHIGVQFDEEGLMRMDSVMQAEVTDKEVKAGVLAPNEARAKRGRKPVKGGESPYLQQQNFSLQALAKRDAQDDPFGTKPAPAPTPPAADTPAPPEKGLEHVGDLVRLDVIDSLARAA